MKYYGKDIKKLVLFDGYKVVKDFSTCFKCDKDNKALALDKACEAAVGLDVSKNVLVYRVVTARWLDSDSVIVKEQTTEELAASVIGRKVKGTGGWIDYEE